MTLEGDEAANLLQARSIGDKSAVEAQEVLTFALTQTDLAGPTR